MCSHSLLSHRPAYTWSMLILITDLSSTLPPPHPLISPSSFLSSFCNQILFVFLSLIVDIEAFSISCIIPWTLLKDGEEGSRVNELTALSALCAPSLKVITVFWSALLVGRLSGYMGAPTYLGAKQGFLPTQRADSQCVMKSFSKASSRLLTDLVKAPAHHLASLSIGPKGEKKQSRTYDNPENMDHTHSL